jgi:hypothetical protein
MNIDPAGKDIQKWNESIQDQTQLSSDQRQCDCDDLSKGSRERSPHCATDQIGMNVRIDVARFGRSIPPLECQRQPDRDEVESVDRDRNSGFRVSTE